MNAASRLRTLAFAVLTLLGVTACGPGSPSAAPSSTPPTGVTPSGDATPTAVPDEPCAVGSDSTIWHRTTAISQPSTPAQVPGLPFVLVGHTRVLRSLAACDGEPAGSFDIDAAVAERPVVVRFSSGDYAAFLTTRSGSVYKVDIAESGRLSLGWRHRLGRDTCPDDGFLAAPAVDGDVVYVATTLGCDKLQANQVVALSADDGHVLWRFNESGENAVGGARGMVLDPVADRLFVSTAGGSGQPTLHAINARTGGRVWAVDAGSVSLPPVVTDDRIFTVDGFGNVRGWSATGESLWARPTSTEFTIVGLVDFGPIDVEDSVILVSAGGQVWPITYEGVALPPLAVPGGDFVTTPALVKPADFRVYVGSAKGAVWQLDLAGGVAERRHAGASDEDPVLCVALVADGDQTNILVGTSTGDLVQLAVP